ncbi:MAG: hypothetical protein EAZ89_07500 [Bacteroidetes bacterium]|nr:MAG: hypothetical protein EAZ89_07500 [Bacteroidota bacterium]
MNYLLLLPLSLTLLFCTSYPQEKDRHHGQEDVFKSIEINYYGDTTILPEKKARFHSGELKAGWTAIDSLEIIVTLRDREKRPRTDKLLLVYEQYISLSPGYQSEVRTFSGDSTVLKPYLIDVERNSLIKGNTYVNRGFDISNTIKYSSYLFAVDSFAISAYWTTDEGVILDRISSEMHYR